MTRFDGTVYCEGPDCFFHEHIGQDTLEHDRLPMGWVRAEEFLNNGVTNRFGFCSWDCVMKRAAAVPPPEVVDFHGWEEQ